MATLGLAILLPAAVSAGVFLTIRRLCPAEIARRYAGPLALTTGFALAYFGIQIGTLAASAVPWVPNRAWHWLPYLGLAAGAVGPIAANGGLLRLERWLLEALICCLAAALLVPTWPNLYPPRWLSVPLLAAFFLVLVRLLEPLSLRASGLRLSTAFTVSAVGVSILIAVFDSLTYATVAVSAAAALAGCCAAILLHREPPIQGLSLPFVILVGGWSYTACIDPPHPLWGLLLAAAAPTALWWRSLRPTAPRHGIAAWLIDAGAVGSIVTLAALLMT